MTMPRDIRTVVNGVMGSFIIHQDKPALSDFDSELDYISRNIFWLKKLLRQNHEASRMYVYAQKRNFVLYLDGDFAVGVLISQKANVHLLHRVVKKTLSALKSTLAENPDNTEEALKEAKEFFDNL